MPVRPVRCLLYQSGGTMTSEPGRVIRHGFVGDFPMGFYNGVFQFMSKIKPVVNTT